MEQIIVDTNILLRFLLRDIEEQYQIAKKLFLKSRTKKIKLIIPQIVIFEIFFNLQKYYQLDKDFIVEKVKNLLTADFLEIQDKDIFKLAIRIFGNYNLDFVDCFLIAKAQISGAKIISFDNKLNKLSKK